ncbi:MAG: ClbS/DfsB family four-helix bundle protein [Anaerolineales bacterium]
MMRDKLIELLEKGDRLEKDFMASLSAEERDANGTFEHWSPKDIVAHNYYWRKHHAEDALEVLAKKSPTQNDEDEINAEVYTQYKDKSWGEIETLIETGLKRMREAIDGLSEDELQSDKFYPWDQGRPLWRELVTNIYTHPIIHLSEWYIKKGNPSRAAEMYQEMTDQLATLDNGPEWQGTIRYNNACSFSLLGDKEKAINELREALKLNPRLTEWSQEDSDFEPIRDEPEYKALYE